MSHYKYLIINEKMMATVSAASTLHKSDLHGSIGLVGKKLVEPNLSVPESSWKGKTENSDVAFHLGQIALSIDLRAKCVTDNIGQVCTFEKLLLATGDTSHQLPFGAHRIIYFRTLQDYQYLRVMAEKSNRFAVIGGGFMGAEVTAALAMNGKEVVMIFPNEEVGGRIFSIDRGLFLNDYFRKKGLVIQAQESVTEFKADGELLRLETKNKHPVAVKNVIVGQFNTQPNVELVEMAGLQDASGIEFLSVNDSSDGHAEGDATNVCPHPFEKQTQAVHQDNTQTEEKNTESNSYHYLPFFKSDISTFLNWNLKQPAGWASLTLFRIGGNHLTQREASPDLL